MSAEYLLTGYIHSIATLSENSKYFRESYISQFLSFSQKDPLKVDRNDLVQYAKMKLSLECKRSTVKLYLVYIIYFYQYLVEEKLYPEEKFALLNNYLKKFKVPKGEKKTALNPDQLDQLLTAVSENPTLKMATWMFLNFGLRLTELIKLTINDLDFENDEIEVLESKGLKTRRIPILKYQKPILKQWLQLRKTFLPVDSINRSFLILKRTEKKPSAKWLQMCYHRLSEKFGFRIYAHRLRRTYASILFFDHNIDIWLISWLLGHARIQTTMTYLGITDLVKKSKYQAAMKNKIIIKV